MNQPVRTSKSATAVFGAGLALGAIAMVGVMKGGVVTPALAGQSFKARTISDINVESMTELRNLDNSVANLADFVEPAVVDIISTSGRQTGADGSRMPEMGGEGSGFIIRPDGYILTNDHVVGGFDHVKVTLKDGRTFTGHVTRAEDSDIAIVKIDATGLPTLSFANSDKVRPGQMSMAVGAPFGLTQSVTVGHISALGREKVIEGRLYPTLLQTDTAINMGNSGGPLVNIEGQVIGVNTAIYSPSGVSSGIGFAIPANQAKWIATTLETKGKVTRSMLGLYPKNMTDYDLLQKHLQGGAVVESMTTDGPAKAAGLEKGDIITKIGSTPILSELDLRNAMMTYAPGTSVEIDYIRNGTHKSTHATLKAYVAPPQERIQEQPEEMPQQQFEGPKGFQVPPNFLDPFHQGPGNGGQPEQALPNDGKPHLGVKVGSITDELRSEYHIPAGVTGAVVAEVFQGSLADSVGVTSGDVITSFNGKKITSRDDLTGAIKDCKVGDTVSFHYVRYGESGSTEGDAKITFK